MACIIGKTTKGLYPNGQGEYGTDFGFTSWNAYNAESYSGQTSLAIDFNVYGTTYFSDVYVPVDTTKWYQHGFIAKTIQRSYNNRLGSGLTGFACYDKNQLFISLQNCGGIGNTYLSRDANPGDTTIYIVDGTEWHNGATQRLHHDL